jgi:hypothetical protein
VNETTALSSNQECADDAGALRGVLNLQRIEEDLLETRRWMKSRVRADTSLGRPDLIGIERMMAGYRLVDAMLARGIDLFVAGNSHLFLELNALVLCGDDAAVREEARRHLRASERHFYDSEPPGGIRDIVEWYSVHKRKPARLCAAGVYIRILSEPELFIEGNHRTGVLVMSYILARNALPPFVLSPANAREFGLLSTSFAAKRKTGPYLAFQMPWLKRRFAKFLARHENPGHLL